MDKYKNLSVGDLLIKRDDSSLHIILDIVKRIGKGYGSKRYRYRYYLVSHDGKKSWYKDVELRVKFRVP